MGHWACCRQPPVCACVSVCLCVCKNRGHTNGLVSRRAPLLGVVSRRVGKASLRNCGNSFRLIFFYGSVPRFVTFGVGGELSPRDEGTCCVLAVRFCWARRGGPVLHLLGKAVGVVVRRASLEELLADKKAKSLKYVPNQLVFLMGFCWAYE